MICSGESSVKRIPQSNKESDNDQMAVGAHDLKMAARYIAFELYHFRLLVTLYRDRAEVFAGGLNRQVYEYSLLLHLRILLDFFYTRPRLQDMGVNHFRVLPAFDVAFPKLKIPRWKVAVKEQLDKRLVHFTEARWLMPTDYEMSDYAQYFDHMLVLISDFEKALPPDLRAEFECRLQTYEQRDRGLP